jgi:predicted DNA binding protein
LTPTNYRYSFTGQLTSQASKKAGTTNLHVDVSDAVNVLVYVGVGGHGDDGLDKADEIQREILANKAKHNSSRLSCRSRSGNSRFESGRRSIATVEKWRTAWCSLAFVPR